MTKPDASGSVNGWHIAVAVLVTLVVVAIFNSGILSQIWPSLHHCSDYEFSTGQAGCADPYFDDPANNYQPR